MFGLELIRYKRKLAQSFSDCFALLKDELGNVPVEIQDDAFINGVVVGICESYLDEQRVQKTSSKALILDAVFEEIYRRESVKVQTQVDVWLEQNDKKFLQGHEQAQTSDNGNLDEKLRWLSAYAQLNFESANNLML